MIKKSSGFFCTSALLICIILFLKITSESVLTVHDDIITYMQVQHGQLWKTALDDAKHGRICHIPLTFLLYIPYLFNNTWVIRTFSVLSVVFDMSALYVLLKNNISEKFAYLSCLLFISFACISNQHSLFTAYVIGHQIPIGLVLFSFNEFIKYYHKHKNTYLVKSSILLFIASFLYETCASYIILYLIIAIYKNKGNIFKNFAKILNAIHYHILFLLIFVIIYAGWRIIYPSDYDGAKLYFGNISGSIFTIIKYSFGMFPCLPAIAMIIKKYITFSEFKKSIDFSVIIIPVVTAVTFCINIAQIKLTKKKNTLIFLCFTGMIIPNILIGFTSKYSQWTNGNSYAYVTSFYSYFFLIPLILLIIRPLVKTEKRSSIVISGIVVFLISLICCLNNAAWNKYFSNKLERYKAFQSAVSDEYFQNLPDNTIVYIPDYIGIHENMEITASFASIYSESRLIFENDSSKIDFSNNVICLRYQKDTNSMIAGNINSSFESYNAFYIYGNGNFELNENFYMNY